MLECSDGKLYTGITSNIERRVKEHKKGHGCRFTKYRRPVRLIYESKFDNKQEANEKEKEIKGFSRRKKLELVREALRLRSVFSAKGG